MGPIAEIAAPILAPVLQPIMQDVGKAIGGALDGALGGLTGGLTGGPLGGLTGSLDGIAKGFGGGQQGGAQGVGQPKTFDQQIADIQNMLHQLASQVGQQHGGVSNPQPFPFRPPEHIHHGGIFNEPIHCNPIRGGSQGNGGVAGTGVTGANGDDWASQAANAAGGQSWSDLKNALTEAEKSGDPAKIAAATDNMKLYTNFVETLSNAEKAQNDAISQIIGNLR